MEKGKRSKHRKDPAPNRTAMMGQRLWQQAERDIETSRFNLQPRTYYAAANFAHQAAEKSLKAAYWHLLGEEPAWNHDIVDIAERLTPQAEQIPSAVRAALSLLEPLFERTRYPSGRADEPIPADIVAEQDARTAVRSAEEVMAWVRTLLLQAPGSARSEKNC